VTNPAAGDRRRIGAPPWRCRAQARDRHRPALLLAPSVPGQLSGPRTALRVDLPTELPPAPARYFSKAGKVRFGRPNSRCTTRPVRYPIVQRNSRASPTSRFRRPPARNLGLMPAQAGSTPRECSLASVFRQTTLPLAIIHTECYTLVEIFYFLAGGSEGRARFRDGVLPVLRTVCRSFAFPSAAGVQSCSSLERGAGSL
jgi:hypothetical protein